MPPENRQPGSLLDFTQSCLRLSWALSLLGASAAADLLTGRARAERSGASLDAVRQAAEGEMGESAREMFRAGDQMQRGMIETFSDLARQPLLDPRRMVRTVLDAGNRFARWAARREDDPEDKTPPAEPAGRGVRPTVSGPPAAHTAPPASSVAR